jgi:hypothetical protein
MKYVKYVLIVAVVGVVVWYLFFRKKETPSAPKTTDGGPRPGSNTALADAFSLADLTNSTGAPQANYVLNTPQTPIVVTPAAPLQSTNRPGIINLP